MNAHLIAAVIDHGITVAAGVMTTLVGFRVMGPKPGANPRFDDYYGKWGKHLRWIGPLLLAIGLALIANEAFSA